MGRISEVVFSVSREREGIFSLPSDKDFFPLRADGDQKSHERRLAPYREAIQRYWRAQALFRSKQVADTEDSFSLEKIGPVLVSTLGGLILGGSLGGVIAFRKGIVNYFFEGLVGGAIFGFAIGMIKPEIFE